jgi:HSP20 family molecular chaperone IbpA
MEDVLMSTAVLERPEIKKVSERLSVYLAPIALYENGESYIVLVELPGADEKAVQVSLDAGVLTIEAPIKVDLPADAQARYSEVRLGNYRRTLNIGEQIDEAKIEACFKSGLLKLTMPKEKGGKARKIPIKTA